MKFFRSPRGPSNPYVAPPPALVDPRADRGAAATPAADPAPAKRGPVVPGRVAPGGATPKGSGSAPPSRPVPATPAPSRPVPTTASATAAAPAPATDGASPPTTADDAQGKWPRRPPQPLTIASHQIAIALGKEGEPIPGLARRFPHVLNRISAVWEDPPATAELIDDLLVDRRGGRRGFPADVLAELLTIRRIVVKRMVSASPKPR